MNFAIKSNTRSDHFEHTRNITLILINSPQYKNVNYLVFQNEEIFVQLDESDELDIIVHPWTGFNLQPHTSTENILV